MSRQLAGGHNRSGRSGPDVQRKAAIMLLAKIDPRTRAVKLPPRLGTPSAVAPVGTLDHAALMRALAAQGELGLRVQRLLRDFGYAPQLRLASLLAPLRHQLPDLYLPLMRALATLQLAPTAYEGPEGVWVGDLYISGDLHVQRPFMVLGNLHISGALFDAGASSVLAVSGDLKAGAVLTHGDIVVDGNFDAGTLLYAYCNDTVLQVQGELRAEVAIEDDHTVQAATRALGQHFSNVRFDRHDEALRQVFVPEAFAQEPDANGYLCYLKLFALIAESRPILQPGL